MPLSVRGEAERVTTMQRACANRFLCRSCFCGRLLFKRAVSSGAVRTIPSLAQTFLPVTREQDWLLPPSLRDWRPEGHLAWFVIDAVAGWSCRRYWWLREDGHGRTAHDPAMMVALLHGVRGRAAFVTRGCGPASQPTVPPSAFGDRAAPPGRVIVYSLASRLARWSTDGRRALPCRHVSGRDRPGCPRSVAQSRLQLLRMVASHLFEVARLASPPGPPARARSTALLGTRPRFPRDQDPAPKRRAAA
jgi:hypothetical protein